MDEPKTLNAFDIASEAAARGLSVSQVCHASGVSWATYWRWKSGKTISLENYNKLKNAVFSYPRKANLP